MNKYKGADEKKSIENKLRFAIFTGGDAPESARIKNYFLKNKFDIVIAADSGLETLQTFSRELQKHILPDIILGDFDSMQNKKTVAKFPLAHLKKFPKDKDFTDTELALHEAHAIADKTKRTPHITLIGGSGGERLDHTLSVYDGFSEKEHADVWFSKTQTLYFFPKETFAYLSNISEDGIISIARLTKSRTRGTVIAKGLKWSAFRKAGMPSISNRISPIFLKKNKRIELFAEKENFLLIVPQDAVLEFRPKENLPKPQKE